MLEKENPVSTYSPADDKFLEIAGVGTWFPYQSYWTSFDSAAEFVPEVAESLIAAVAEILNRRFNVNPTTLRIRTRLSASPLVAGRYDARATILFRASEGDAVDEVDGMRSAAARVLATVVHPDASGSPDAEFLSAEEMAFPIDSLFESPFAPYLGTRISNDLVAHVPGRPLLHLKHKFRDAPLLRSVPETFEVIGRIHDTKLGGEFRSVSITAFRADNLAELEQARVLVTPELREQIWQVVREPSRRLRMTVIGGEIHTERSVPRVVYVLKDLRFDDAAQV
jgi:hypothetical protein